MTAEVTDKQYGRLQRQLDDLKRRVKEGTLPIKGVRSRVQKVSEGEWNVIEFITSVRVNYNMSFQEMLEKINFEYVTPNIKKFNIEKSGVRYGLTDIRFAVLDFFGEDLVVPDDVVKRMTDFNCRPATLPEVLAFVAEGNDVRNPLAIPGSPYGSHANHSLPVMRPDPRGLELKLCDSNKIELMSCESSLRFAAVKFNNC